MWIYFTWALECENLPGIKANKNTQVSRLFIYFIKTSCRIIHMTFILWKPHNSLRYVTIYRLLSHSIIMATYHCRILNSTAVIDNTHDEDLHVQSSASSYYMQEWRPISALTMALFQGEWCILILHAGVAAYLCTHDGSLPRRMMHPHITCRSGGLSLHSRWLSSKENDASSYYMLELRPISALTMALFQGEWISATSLPPQTGHFHWYHRHDTICKEHIKTLLALLTMAQYVKLL